MVKRLLVLSIVLLHQFLGSDAIMGGEILEAGSRPYQVALFLHYDGEDGFCGGTLVTTKHVLTAAHCSWDGERRVISYTVVLGAFNLYDVNERGSFRITANLVELHPEYDPVNVRNDLAIITFPTEIVMSDTIRTIRLATRAESTSGMFLASASGWGKISNDAKIVSPFLFHIQANIMSNCASFYHNLLDETHRCLPNNINVRTTCQGDNGGPVIRTIGTGEEEEQILVGTISFVPIYCGFLPSVFTLLTDHSEWIESITGLEIEPPTDE